MKITFKEVLVAATFEKNRAIKEDVTEIDLGVFDDLSREMLLDPSLNSHWQAMSYRDCLVTNIGKVEIGPIIPNPGTGIPAIYEFLNTKLGIKPNSHTLPKSLRQEKYGSI